MNKYEVRVLDTLSDKYPAYSFEFEEYPSMFIVQIKNRSSGYSTTKRLIKYSDVSLIMRTIERMIDEMREEELKNTVDWSGKNLIRNTSYYGMWPGNKYSIAPKEVIFHDEKTTIVNWTDGTKTIVKCSDGDTFSPEAGIALCYMKRFITDNDSERFHRLLKGLISVSKFKNSKQEDKISLFDCAEVIKGTISKLQTLYTEVKNDHDTGASDNTGDNDPDNTSLEVES